LTSYGPFLRRRYCYFGLFQWGETQVSFCGNIVLVALCKSGLCKNRLALVTVNGSMNIKIISPILPLPSSDQVVLREPCDRGERSDGADGARAPDHAFGIRRAVEQGN